MKAKLHRLPLALRQSRGWLVLALLLSAVAGGAWGFCSYRYSAVVVFARGQGTPESRPLGELAPLLQERLREPKTLSADVTVRPGKAPETLELVARGPVPNETVSLANTLAVQAVSLGAELASDSGKTMLPIYEGKLSEVEGHLKSCSERLVALQQELGGTEPEAHLEGYAKRRDELQTRLAENASLARTLELQLNNLHAEVLSHHPAVLTAKQALDKALLRYTEDHPKVEELKLTLASVQARVRDQKDEVDPDIALNGNTLAQGLYARLMGLRSEQRLLDAKKQELLAALNSLDQKIKTLPETEARYAKAKADYQLWKTTHGQLLTDLNRQQLLASTAMVPFTLDKKASAPSGAWAQRWGFAALTALGAASLAGVLVGGGIAWRTCRDPRIKSETELLAAASVPVLGVLPDLQNMSARDQEKWAFQTFTALKARLAPAGGAALVCGFTSSRRGEGRSTWIRLLAGTARKQGYQVLVVATVPTLLEGKNSQEVAEQPVTGDTPTVTLCEGLHPVQWTTESSAQVFAVPSAAAWSLENRLQWQQGLQQLGKEENRVILVEFPPASEPETVLLANNFPNLIWVCGQDMATEGEIRTQMETLASSQAKVVGTVLNFAQA